MAPIPTSLCELFTQSVQQYPENLAVDHEDGCLTYRELDDVSSVLAHELALLGVNDGSPVLLVTAHGSFNIIAILAILKAGGCFVPIDRRSWSSEMINYVCTTVNSHVIINTTTEPFTASNESHHVLHLTSLPSVSPSHRYSSSCYKPSNADACIIFTSGSTGRPKGVILSHKSLCLYSKTSPMNLDIRPGDRLLHILSVAFDACACMLFSALGNGGTVVPTQAEDIYVKAISCSVVAATPSILSNLPRVTSNDSVFANIHTVILGGETATSDLLESWIDAGIRVLIGYGATETTSMGSVHVVARDPKTQTINPSLIGGSIEQSPIWLVNCDFQPIEDELSEGEIIISGDCVSRGYYQDDIKTGDSFIYWNSLRVYKTGDYGRWVRCPAGDRVVEFRGRKDRTVKNGGFLVNLDRDVEDALNHAGMSLGVTSVCAAVTEDGIVAAVTPENVDKIALLTKARQTMCSYCIPYRIEALQKFPTSSNGKVQHKRVLEIISAIDCGKDPDLYTTTPSPLAAQVSDIEATEEQEKEKLSKILSAVSSLFGYSGGKLRDIKGSDSFSALGGSSLLAFKLISILRLHNLRIIPRDLFSCHTFEEIAKEATTTSNSDYKVPRADGNLIITKKLAALRKQARDVLGLADESFDIGPLASLQLVLAVPTLSCKSKNVNQVKLTYSGAYASTMERAWRTVWQAEPVFRTEICLIIGCGVQIIHKQPFRKPKKELYSSQSDYDTAVRDADIDVGLGCSLEFVIYCPTTSPGITAATDAASIPKPVKEMTIVLTVHHSLMDGISLQILLAKVERVARGWPLPFSSGSIEANLGLISIQQNRDVAARKFFSVYLKEARVKNSLINDRNGIVKEDGNPARRDNTVLLRSPVKSEEVADFARQSCVSIACIYYTAWAMAMSAIERDCTVIIGSVFSNRGFQPEFENTIGLYISTLPLVVKLDDDESVASLLQKVMGDIITIGQYAWASSDQIGIGSRVRSLVSLQPPLPDQDSNPPPVRVESLENSDFPLSLLMESTGEFRIVYDSHAFNKTTIRRLAGHFKHALRGILHYALVGECRKINELLETVYEQSEMVTIKRNEQTVKQALEASIDRFRNLVAIEDCKGTSLTYGQLDEQTNIIASRINEHLADRKVTAVAVYGDGSVEWLLGLLAILKTSRAFVPIDPKWPMERKMMVLEASGAAAVLIPDLIHRNQVPETAEILVVKNMLSHKISEQEAERLPDFGSVDSVLVFIFTSGTTGVPKGIPTTNQSFLALQSNSEATMFAAPGRRIAQFMSPAFDVCNVEIFSALLHGATLVLRDSEDPYANLLKVNTAIMTPAVLSVLKPDEFPNIEIIYSTGESITSVIVQNFAMNKLLYNSYGPAECAVYGLFERMVPGDVITIGVPSDTVRIYILDEKQNHVPHGAQGEIYLAGVQVLQQYINSPEQTALRILPDPWCPEDRMYRTGDYGICGKDNRVTYTGRMDRQVKIRGFRVELDGVEQAILSEPVADNICQCSVIAIDGTLVAYIKFSSEELHSSIEDRISRLRDRLDKTLLPSWVPQLFISLHDFPTSTNGKVDNKVLEDMYRSRTPLREEAVQRLPMLPTDSGIEHKLAEAWREVLQLQPHVHLEYSDNFFGLGGHSVLTMLLATKLTSIFEVKVTARELLPAPAFQDQVNTIERLLSVKEINTHQKDSRSDAKFLKNGRNALPTEALTDLERQVWLQYQVAETVTAFNIANILTISGQVDYSKLLYSFNAALASDPVLSCNFVEGPDGPRRVIRDATPRVREVAQLDIAAEINLAFNLEHDELIRLHFIQQSEEKEHRLITQIVIVTSHSIADLATVQNLLRLVSAAYAGENTAVHKTPQHLYSSQWQYNPSLPEQNFWKTYLKGHDARRSQSSYFQLPLLPSTMATFHGSSRTRKFIGDTITTLNSLIKRLGITHHQMALTVASLLLQWLLDEDDIILGAPNANRSSSIERDALGQFLDRLPIRIRLDNSRSGNTGLNLTQVLVDVRDSALQALANAIPFSKILESLNVLSGDLKHPIFDCMVTFHPSSASLNKWLQLPLCQVAVSPLFPKGSKFPLMLEWFELDSDRWSLHIEHDTHRLPSAMIGIIEVGLQTILEAIADECSLVELHDRLDAATKVNRSSVGSQLVAGSNSGQQSHSPPLSVTEVIDIIRREMASCLGVNDTDILPETCFFSTGANSKAAISLRHRLQAFGLEVSLRAIFMAKSPMELIRYIIL